MLVVLLEAAASPYRLKGTLAYLVVGIDDSHYRLVNDDREPVLYPKPSFRVVDHRIPGDWAREDFPDGEYYIDPPETSAVGFYEDLFDGDPTAVAVFKGVWKRLQEWQAGIAAPA